MGDDLTTLVTDKSSHELSIAYNLVCRYQAITGVR